MPDVIQTYKLKKYDYFRFGVVFNHPNRLAGISMSGETVFNRDGRISESGLSTTRTLIELDYSILPSWNREFRDKNPLFFNPQTGFASFGFGLFHLTTTPWLIFSHIKGSSSSTVIGTTKEFAYSRASNTDPWTEDSLTTADFSVSWSPDLTGGGDPASGGKGADNEDNSIAITGIPTTYFSGVTIHRLPWDQAWTSETTILSDAFDDYLADVIAANPSTAADYSGTCTAEVVFTF